MERKAKKILYCITKADWGGAQRYVYDLATSLSKTGFETRVVLGSDGPLAEKIRAAGVKTIILGGLYRDIKIWSDLLSLFKLIKIFRKEKPDVIHLNSSKMGLLGSVAGKITGVSKIIFTGHGWAFNENRGLIQKVVIKFLHRLTIHLADTTIAVSEKTRDQITNAGESDKKIVVIRNGVKTINFLSRDLAREEIRKRLPTNINLTNKSWIGTISELHENKGLKYMIEAMRKSVSSIFVIIGEGEKRTELQKMIRDCNLDNKVFLVGKIDGAAKYVKAFDIFTLTSITEALPYVLLEAGLAGLPVVASKVGGIPEIVENDQSGVLVESKNVREIVVALTLLQGNPEKMAQLGHKLQAKVVEKFSRDKMLRETLALY